MPLVCPVFREKNQNIADRAVEILKTERPMTLRQLFYRMISCGAMQNNAKQYARLGRITTRLRESETVPLTWIVDHVRTTLKPNSWSGLDNFGESMQRWYRKDFWASMPSYVEIIVEKDAVAGTIQPVTYEYDVRLRVCRGYSSLSFAGDIAAQWRRIVKPIFAYYLGDFDPSGFDLERDMRQKIERWSGKSIVAPGEDDGRLCCVWQRLGVVATDFAQHNLIALPVKKGDKRAAKFVRQHGTACAEIDAIAPNELRRRVRAAIDSHIDQQRWGRLKEIEREEKMSLDAYIRGMKSGENESSFDLN